MAETLYFLRFLDLPWQKATEGQYKCAVQEFGMVTAEMGGDMTISPDAFTTRLAEGRIVNGAGLEKYNADGEFLAIVIATRRAIDASQTSETGSAPSFL